MTQQWPVREDLTERDPVAVEAPEQPEGAAALARDAGWFADDVVQATAIDLWGPAALVLAVAGVMVWRKVRRRRA